jgi:SPP1 family phage portal protein
MTILELLRQEGKFDKAKAIICQKPSDKTWLPETWKNEFSGKHKITSDPYRIGQYIGSGNNRRYVEPAKEIITLQKKIVRMAVAFMFGKPVELVLNNPEDRFQEPFNLLKDTWKNLKLDYINKKLMRRTCIYTEAAELWYTAGKEDGPVEIGVNILSYDNGDEIYPHFDENGKLIAFARKYKRDEINEQGTIVKVNHTDIYTDEWIYKWADMSGGMLEEIPNLFQKIPIVYYEQDKPEWSDVQTLIDRIEMLISRHADTNDYFGAPIIKTWGEFTQLPDKEDDGKSVNIEVERNRKSGKFEPKGGIEFLTWDYAPESIKLEFENIINIIYSMTSTPDISFNNVKGMPDVSGIALRLMFLDPMLKALDKQELYGEMLDRRINVMKAILSIANIKNAELYKEMDVSVKFQSVLPDNLKETIEMLVTATGDAVMSQEGAVRRNPLVDDADAEMERIEQQSGGGLGESFNI